MSTDSTRDFTPFDIVFIRLVHFNFIGYAFYHVGSSSTRELEAETSPTAMYKGRAPK